MKKKHLGIIAALVVVAVVIAGVALYLVGKTKSDSASPSATTTTKKVDVKDTSARGVNVLPSPKRPVVALTFDAPNLEEGALKEVLAELKKANVHATFFLNGDNVQANRTSARDVSVAGNEVGIYTWSTDLASVSEADALAQLQKAQAEIKDILLETPAFFRVANDQVSEGVTQAVSAANLHLAGWTVDSADAPEKTADSIASYVLGNVKSGSIIALHLTSEDAKALPQILAGLKENKLAPNTLVQAAYLSSDEKLRAIILGN